MSPHHAERDLPDSSRHSDLDRPISDREPGLRGRGRRMALRWSALPSNVRAAIWILIASAGFSAMGALIKLLSASLDSFQIVFFRSVAGFLVMVPIALHAGRHVWRTRHPRLHLARGAAGITAMSCGFYALAHLPLATAVAITFTKPLFMIVLAVMFLGESVRWRRWSATAVGFLGVLIMLRPGSGGLEPAMLVALMQALAIAAAVTLVKRMPVSESNLTVLLYFAVISTIGTLGPALWVWQTPTWAEAGIAAAMGLLGVGAQTAIVKGYRTGEATAAAPFDYSRLLFASIFGFLLFAEVPDAWTIMGAGVIVASTVYIARREARIGAASPGPGPAPD